MLCAAFFIVMLSVVLLNVVLLSVIMVSIVALILYFHSLIITVRATIVGANLNISVR
jgi:hypothetical protein